MQSGRLAVTSKSSTASAVVADGSFPTRSMPSTAKPRRHRLGQLFRRAGHIDEITEPGDQQLHSGNCSRNRRSFS
jgi:hypothetical protein